MGEVDGQPFYAMELVAGDSLSDLVADGPLGNREAARYVAQVADAIHEAHQHGILHRDIKPQNVLIEKSSGVAKLADFGLAQLAHTHKANAGDHSVAGTLAYMAPEQFRDPLPTTSNDIYSLGATLYHLIAGQPPFLADSLSEASRQIEEVDPIPPSRLNPNVSSELERTCLKALSKSPEDRHATAGQLTAELEHYLSRPQRAGDMASISGRMLLSGLLFLLLNVGVFLLLPTASAVPPLREFAIWVLIACMYPVGFSLLIKLPVRAKDDYRETRAILWTLVAGKMFAAVCICLMLRVMFVDDVRTAIVVSYPVFAALSGLVTFAISSNFWSGFYWTAVGFWGLSVLMILQGTSRWIPLEYGAVLSAGVAAFALYVRRLAREYR